MATILNPIGGAPAAAGGGGIYSPIASGSLDGIGGLSILISVTWEQLLAYNHIRIVGAIPPNGTLNNGKALRMRLYPTSVPSGISNQAVFENIAHNTGIITTSLPANFDNQYFGPSDIDTPTPFTMDIWPGMSSANSIMNYYEINTGICDSTSLVSIRLRGRAYVNITQVGLSLEVYIAGASSFGSSLGGESFFNISGIPK